MRARCLSARAPFFFGWESGPGFLPSEGRADGKGEECTETRSDCKRGALHSETVLKLTLWWYSMIYALVDDNKELWSLHCKPTSLSPNLAFLPGQDVYPALNVCCGTLVSYSFNCLCVSVNRKLKQIKYILFLYLEILQNCVCVKILCYNTNINQKNNKYVLFSLSVKVRTN